MNVQRYRKKPVEVEAVYYTGWNQTEVMAWCGGQRAGARHELIGIDTLEGRMFAKPGDYIIRGVAGEFYPCRQDIFEKTYEVAK